MSNRRPVLGGRVVAAKAVLAQSRNLGRQQSPRPALAFTVGLLLRGWDSLRPVPYIRARPHALLAATAATLALAAVLLTEMQSSILTSVLLPPLVERMRSVAGPGPSRQVRFPAQGPYDQRLGYSSMPGFIAALESRGWDVVLQARPSDWLRAWIDATGHAVYREKTVSGLTLLDRSGAPLYRARFPGRIFGDASDIPPLLTATLLRIEDRHLLDQGRPRRNPAIDWPRFLLAIAGHVTHGAHAGAGGASTLATQIEKFRHSPQGRTEDYAEKLRQMATASLRIYAAGGDTTGARRQLVATYLDSVPLSSRAGYGEVIGLGDGLWAWYGIDFGQVRYALALPQQDPRQLAALAEAYKPALSLLLAERRPTYYLVAHHAALETLTNRYLFLLADQGVITPRLRDAALGVKLRFRMDPPPPAATPFAERKGVDALRFELLQQLQLPSLNGLDRLDLAAQSTIDDRAQRAVTGLLQGLADPAYAGSLGLVGPELLPAKRLDQVVYSVLVYERTAAGNELRVHADNLNQPFDVNSGAKLILGSTAKLRTLITYLDIVVELQHRLAPLPPPQRRAEAERAGDPLSLWAAAYLDSAPNSGLRDMLEAAMQRRYSANPYRSFFTGGGAHVFHNFKKFEDAQNPTVEDAFEHSVNLAFIRLMRDITRYYIAQQGDAVKRLLADADDPARQEFLRHFADEEGRGYLSRFYEDYRGLPPREALEQLAAHARQSPVALAAIFLSTRLEASPDELRQYLEMQGAWHRLDERGLRKLYAQCQSGRLSLADEGYLAGVHPLEIWLVGYLRSHPDASRSEVLQAGTLARQQAYDWLFRTRHPARQNERIQILLEQMAFERIADDWHRQGYPFRHLVPSLASAIGSSGDRPDALAELAGIISAGGLRVPAVDLTSLHFAAGTPYETALRRAPAAAERVLDPQVAELLRRSLQGVVEHGTAQRLRGGYLKPDGSPLPVGGKTGTGDNRQESFASGHRLIASVPVSRSATFAFLLGERHFGVVTVYVPGKQAAQFHFTSALAVELLRVLAPALTPLIEAARPGATTAATAAPRSWPASGGLGYDRGIPGTAAPGTGLRLRTDVVDRGG